MLTHQHTKQTRHAHSPAHPVRHDNTRAERGLLLWEDWLWTMPNCHRHIYRLNGGGTAAPGSTDLHGGNLDYHQMNPVLKLNAHTQTLKPVLPLAPRRAGRVTCMSAGRAVCVCVTRHSVSYGCVCSVTVCHWVTQCVCHCDWVCVCMCVWALVSVCVCGPCLGRSVCVSRCHWVCVCVSCSVKSRLSVVSLVPCQCQCVSCPRVVCVSVYVVAAVCVCVDWVSSDGR